MDFFNVGFVLCALCFPFGREVGYILRLLGAGFMAGGIRELGLCYGDDRLGGHRKGVLLIALLSLAGTAQALFLRFGMISADTGNILSTAAGLLCGGTVIAAEWLLLRQLRQDETLVNDPSLMRKLVGAWKRYAVCAAVTLIAEAVGRFAVTDSTPYLAAGVVQVYSRILVYAFIIDMAVKFNRCRMDFNKMHPV